MNSTEQLRDLEFCFWATADALRADAGLSPV